MTCDELQLLLPEGAADDAAKSHLGGCADCREVLAVLSAAAQPGLTAGERAKLAALPSTLLAQWVGLQKRRSSLRTFASLAIAASVGAVVASGVMWKLNPAGPAPTGVEPAEALLVWMEDSTPQAADDELNFEVSWPSLTEEGDVL